MNRGISIASMPVILAAPVSAQSLQSERESPPLPPEHTHVLEGDFTLGNPGG